MNANYKPFYLPCLIVLISGAAGAALFSHSVLLGRHVSQMHMDAQVYIYAATQILHGKILYRDLFDHKGPVMYLFECLGILLSPNSYTGVWFVQWFAFVAGISPLFIFWSKKYGVARSGIALLLMIAWIYRTKTIGDNLPEIFALGLISFFIFLNFKLQQSPQHAALYAMLAGVSTMSLFLLKPNFVVLVLPGMCYVCYLFYRQKELARLLGFYFAGLCAILLPFVIYFSIHHALDEAVFACWTFNFSYISNQQLTITESIRDVFFKPLNYFFVFILLFSITGMIINRVAMVQYLWLLSTVLLAVVVLTGMPGRGAESVHYAIPLAPLIAGLAILTLQPFNRMQLVIMFCIAAYFFKPLMIHLWRPAQDRAGRDLTLQYLQQSSKPGETLCVLGNHSSLYLQSGLQCNTPYFFTYPILLQCGSHINEKFRVTANVQKANWIVYQQRMPQEPCVTDLLKDYNLVQASNDAQLYRLK
ncbi:MAG: hypothetical protein IT257_10590 [Chitinophagaceae bacterium]|nr:hypothetical protein [Chitinophagaceae bacterium]